MRNIKIIGDSCCDYIDGSDELNFIERVPLTIELDGESCVDDQTMDCGLLIKKMAASSQAPRSACPAPSAFAQAAEQGDEAYIVTLSEMVSGTYNSAEVGAKMAMEAKPGLKAHVFNSHSAAAGEIAVCFKLKELAEQGLPFEEIVEKTEGYIRGLTTFFVLETLDVFRKNGRLTHLQSLATAALRLRMIMGADENGAIVVRGKALSMRRALKGLVELIRERCEALGAAGHETLYITQCACAERAEEIKNDVLANCPAIKKVVILRAGGISTIYANAGGVVIGF